MYSRIWSRAGLVMVVAMAAAVAPVCLASSASSPSRWGFWNRGTAAAPRVSQANVSESVEEASKEEEVSSSSTAITSNATKLESYATSESNLTTTDESGGEKLASTEIADHQTRDGDVHDDDHHDSKTVHKKKRRRKVKKLVAAARSSSHDEHKGTDSVDSTTTKVQEGRPPSRGFWWGGGSRSSSDNETAMPKADSVSVTATSSSSRTVKDNAVDKNTNMDGENTPMSGHINKKTKKRPKSKHAKSTSAATVTDRVVGTHDSDTMLARGGPRVVVKKKKVKRHRPDATATYEGRRTEAGMVEQEDEVETIRLPTTATQQESRKYHGKKKVKKRKHSGDGTGGSPTVSNDKETAAAAAAAATTPADASLDLVAAKKPKKKMHKRRRKSANIVTDNLNQDGDAASEHDLERREFEHDDENDQSVATTVVVNEISGCNSEAHVDEPLTSSSSSLLVDEAPRAKDDEVTSSGLVQPHAPDEVPVVDDTQAVMVHAMDQPDEGEAGEATPTAVLEEEDETETPLTTIIPHGETDGTVNRTSFLDSLKNASVTGACDDRTTLKSASLGIESNQATDAAFAVFEHDGQSALLVPDDIAGVNMTAEDEVQALEKWDTETNGSSPNPNVHSSILTDDQASEIGAEDTTGDSDTRASLVSPTELVDVANASSPAQEVPDETIEATAPSSAEDTKDESGDEIAHIDSREGGDGVESSGASLSSANDTVVDADITVVTSASQPEAEETAQNTTFRAADDTSADSDDEQESSDDDVEGEASAEISAAIFPGNKSIGNSSYGEREVQNETMEKAPSASATEDVDDDSDDELIQSDSSADKEEASETVTEPSKFAPEAPLSSRAVTGVNEEDKPEGVEDAGVSATSTNATAGDDVQSDSFKLESTSIHTEPVAGSDETTENEESDSSTAQATEKDHERIQQEETRGRSVAIELDTMAEGGVGLDASSENVSSEGKTSETVSPRAPTDIIVDPEKDDTNTGAKTTAVLEVESANVTIASTSQVPATADADEVEIKKTSSFKSPTMVDLATLAAIEDHDTDMCISAVTWNLAEESPQEEEAQFIRKFRKGGVNGQGSDFVLISAQECENIKPRRTEGRRSREIRRLMVKMLGKKYVPIAIHQLGGIQFGLFCKRSNLHNVEHVSVADVTCGIGNVFHNKGAIAAFVQMKARAPIEEERSVNRAKSLKMLFVTAHMAAHVKNFDARDADFWRIVTELESQAPPAFVSPRKREGESSGSTSALLDSMDRIFFCGDLNYRVDLPREMAEHSVLEMTKFLQSTKKQSNPKADRIRDELLKHDQLLSTMAERRAFPGFAEGKITFPPTFKFDKGTPHYDTSHKQRIPAWTDRVLFKPSGTRVLEYDAILDSQHSDHRPVFATFRVSRAGRELPKTSKNPHPKSKQRSRKPKKQGD